MTSGLLRVVIADDQPAMRAGLRAMLATDPTLVVVGEAATGWDALRLCRHLQPTVVLLDIGLPQLDGVAVTRAIRRYCPATSVVIVTVHADPASVTAARLAGAA